MGGVFMWVNSRGALKKSVYLYCMKYYVKLNRSKVPVSNSLVINPSIPDNSGDWIEVTAPQMVNGVCQSNSGGGFINCYGWKFYYLVDDNCVPISGSNIKSCIFKPCGGYVQFFPVSSGQVVPPPPPPPPSASYSLVTNQTTVNEGGSFTITLIANNATMPTGGWGYVITGVNSSDIGGAALSGTFTATGQTKTYNVTLDQTTENQETFSMSLTNNLASVSVVINDTSVSPNYSLTQSETNVNEGENFNITFVTNQAGNFAYTITGVTSADINGASLTGIITNGDILNYVVSADGSTERTETFRIALDNGQASASVTINDTSVTPTPTYSLTRSAAAINEGGTFTITFATNQGGSYPYTITGVSSADIGGASLTGSVSNGSILTYTVTPDLTTEGVETFAIALNNGQASTTVTINDTSVTPPPPPIVATPTLTAAPGGLSLFTYAKTGWTTQGAPNTLSFNISGVDLTNNVVLTSPTNYQISLSPTSGFTTTITLSPVTTILSTTTVYVRLKTGLAVQSYNENISITSTGASSIIFPCSGRVDAITVLNVKSGGALGNGSTDDTAVIANAIQLAQSNNISSIYFPAGTYKVTTGFNLPDNMTVYGDGPTSILKLFKTTYLTDFATQGAMFMGRPSYGNGDVNDGTPPTGYGPNSSKTTLAITIKNLAIDLQKDPANYDSGYEVSPGLYRPPMAYAIRFYNPVSCLIDNVRISNPWLGGIQFQTTIDGTKSSGNVVRNCTIVMQEWYAPFPNGSINYNDLLPGPTKPNAKAMIGVEMLSYCNFGTNNGSACYDRTGSPSPPYNCNDAAKININYTDGSYTPSRTFDNLITNCTISGGSHCISFANVRNSIISNNTITNGSNRGVIFSSRCMDNIVSGNTLSLCGSTGILMGYGAYRNTVRNNTILSVRGGEGQGIGLNVLANSNTIEYNTISNCPQVGIRAGHGPNNNIIRNNTITGNNLAAQAGIAILANWLKYYCLDALKYGDALTANNNVCTNNIISNVGTGVYLGDEKGFAGNFLNNTVSGNTYTNVTTRENLTVVSYNGSTTTYFPGTPCVT